MPLLQEDGLHGEVDGRVEAAALGGRESQGERVRRSLVTLDNALPAIALPDGVHCRSFTGARGAAEPARSAQSSHARDGCHQWKPQHRIAYIPSASTCRQGQLSAVLWCLNWRGRWGHGGRSQA